MRYFLTALWLFIIVIGVVVGIKFIPVEWKYLFGFAIGYIACAISILKYDIKK